jgi:6-pyruvoyltetrahydropterin/6-carboxytetrahydropterin synthase
MARAVTVTRVFTFDSAHVLPWHTGKCSRLHGHTYRLEVSVRGALDERGIVMDFADISEVVDKVIVQHLDHTLLNDLIDNPTVERVALHILDALVDELPVSAVRLWETPNSFVEVTP